MIPGRRGNRTRSETAAGSRESSDLAIQLVEANGNQNGDGPKEGFSLEDGNDGQESTEEVPSGEKIGDYVNSLTDLDPSFSCHFYILKSFPPLLHGPQRELGYQRSGPKIHPAWNRI